MLVTDKKYSMEKRYVAKLDLMIKRMQGTDDNVVAVDGDEGQGKTELTVGTCYYVSYKTGRPYGVDNIFFDLDEMIKFASETEDQIIHLDEGAFGLLRTQWHSKTQQKFIQLVMVARKKRHFIIICIPKFHRLPQYVIEERSIGLVHVYSRKNLEKGRFCYFNKQAKDRLYQDWEKKKIKTYKKRQTFHGTFVEAMKKVFTKEQIKLYDVKKDYAIMGLTKEKEKPLNKMEQRHCEQRNNIILGLKKELNLSSPKLQKLLKIWNVNISQSQIKGIYLTENVEKPTIAGDTLNNLIYGCEDDNFQKIKEKETSSIIQ